MTPDYTLSSLARSSGPAPRRLRRTGLIVGLAVAGGLVVILAAAGGALVMYLWSSSGTMTSTGSITITDPTAVRNDANEKCAGKNGYDDIAVGAEVNITDASNATVALGQISDSQYVSQKGCVLTWTITGVPTGKKFYGIAVGHRAAIKIPEAQMRRPVTLSLG